MTMKLLSLCVALVGIKLFAQDTGYPVVHFTSAASVTVYHMWNTTSIVLQCEDSSGVEIVPANVTLNVNYVVIAFSAASTGVCRVRRWGGLSTIMDEGTGLNPRTKLDFVGTAVQCSDNSAAAKTICTINYPSNITQIATRNYSDLQNIPSTFNPSAHAASHQHNGSDEVATATPSANAIPKAGSSGTLNDNWLSANITRDSEINVQGTANEITSSGSGVAPVLSIASTFRITGKTATAPIKTGTTPPATCVVGDYFFDTDAPAGQNTYACTATDTWTLQGDGGGGGGGSGDITDVGNCSTGACFQSVTANQVLASPDGSVGQVAPRALVAADLPVRTFDVHLLRWNVLPDTSGDVFMEPFSIKATNDFWPYYVTIFNDTSTDLRLYGAALSPQNLVSAPQVCVVWTSTATTGNVRWEFAYRVVSGTASLDQSTAQETVAANAAAPSAGMGRVESCQALTAGNFSAGATLQWRLSRLGSDTANDTMAAAAIVHDVFLRYNGR